VAGLVNDNDNNYNGMYSVYVSDLKSKEYWSLYEQFKSSKISKLRTIS